MNKLRKFVIASVMTLSVIAMSGLAVAPANAAASAGDLIKMEGLSSVYYLGDDGKRYVFPNESTYFSWYSDFSSVVTIPASELQSYPLGGNVTMRPGTTLVKITTDPSVYAVEPNGVLRKIQNESQAAALYGTDWNKRIVDLADSFFTNYTIGQPLADGEVPAGSLVKMSGSADVYYYDGSDYRVITSEAAFNANRFMWKHILTLNVSMSMGTSITGMEEALVDVSQNATGPGEVITGSGLMVSVNSSTPASMNIPANVSVEMLKINLTAASDGPVNVSSIVLTAIGLSDATNIDNVTFFDNGMKIGTSKNVNSNRNATFNFASPIYVAAGSTKTLTVKATVASSSGSYGLSIASASDVIASAGSVSGAFPVEGNLMSAVTSNVGTVTVTDTDVSSTVNFGEDNVLLADFTLAVATEDALLQSISLYNSGTNSDDIVDNLKLFIDGEEVASGSYMDRYATFTLNNYEIEKGNTVNVEVRGDIGVTSANDTIKFYLKNSVDLVIVGKTHGFGLSTTNSFSTALSTITLTTGDFTIDMDKAATPAKDVLPDANDVVLATIELTSNGEDATITAIAGANFYITTNSSNPDSLLENIEMKDKSTGGLYDFTVSTTTNKIMLASSDEISLMKGQTKTFELRADVVSTVAQGETFQVTLQGSGMTIEGDTSGASITNITPSSVTGSLITVEDASLTLTPTALVNTTIVGGSTGVVVYQGKVKAGTADDVKIQSIKLASATSSETNSAFTDSNISKLTLWLNGKILKTVSNQISGDSTTTNGTITFNSLNTAYYTVPAGAEYDLVVTADFASSLTSGDFKLKDADSWTARSVTGNDTVDVTTAATYSRVVTVADTGTLTISLLTSDSKASRDSWVLAGSESVAGRYVGELKFVTAREDIKVESLSLTATSSSDATNADIEAIQLVTADGVIVASESVDANGDVTFDPFNVVFEADKSTSLFISVKAKGINDGGVTATANSGAFIAYELSAATAKGNESGETLSSGASTLTVTTGTASKTATIVGSKLTSVVNAMSDGTLTGGTGKILGKYTLVFDNNSNRLANNDAMKAVLKSITLTFSNTATVTNPYLYIEGYSSDKAQVTDVIDGTTTTTATFNTAALANLVDSAEVDGSITLVVAGQVTTAGQNQYVQTSIADLDGSGSDDDIQYDADGTESGTTLTNMLLPVTSVNGATLSN